MLGLSNQNKVAPILLYIGLDDLYTMQNENPNPVRAGWADLYGQTELGYLAAIQYFHSTWYRDHLVQYIAKSEQLYFGLMGPNIHKDFGIWKA